jgi:hypothetical protein
LFHVEHFELLAGNGRRLKSGSPKYLRIFCTKLPANHESFPPIQPFEALQPHTLQSALNPFHRKCFPRFLLFPPRRLSTGWLGSPQRNRLASTSPSL